jgi:thiamine biosynthesis protein ThiS
MWVTINGFKEKIPDRCSIARVIEDHQEYEVHMIVELNHQFVHQKDYQKTVLKEGDVLELIHPAFGG